MKGRMGYMRPFVMGVPWQLYLSMYYPIIWPVTVLVMIRYTPQFEEIRREAFK